MCTREKMKRKKLSFHHWLCIKVFCASKLSVTIFFSFPPSFEIKFISSFRLRVLILSLCCEPGEEARREVSEKERKKSVCILNRMRFGIFMCFLCSAPTYVHDISSIVQAKCLRSCLRRSFYELFGATVQAICTSNGKLLVFRRQNSLAHSARQAAQTVSSRRR